MAFPILDNFLRHRREKYEIRMNMYNQVRRMLSHYDAGEMGRLQDDWATTTNTPSQNFKANWRTIIARSIHSYDNNPHTQALLGTLLSNVIGNGIRPVAMVKNNGGEPVEGINKVLNEAWKRYNDEWDSRRKDTHAELQKVRFGEIFRTGSTITNLRPSEKGSFLSITNQVINVLRLDDSRDLLSESFDDPQTKNTVFGININENERAISYWIKGLDRPVSAELMKLDFKTILAEQYIGMPWLMAALKYLWANEQLISDKLISSRIQAMIALFIPNSLMSKLMGQQKNSDNQLEWKQGHVYTGKVGEEPKVIQPDDSIKDVLEPLQRLLLHAISTTLGLSYQTVTRDLVRTNMASGRINVNEDRKVFRAFQKWFSKDVLQPDWNVFVRYMFLEGKIAGKSIIDYNQDKWKYNQAHWIPTGFDFIDPSKEATAAIELINNKQMTYEKWYGEQGTDYRDAFAQIAKEQKLMKELKIEPVEVQNAMQKQKAGVSGDSDREEDD